MKPLPSIALDSLMRGLVGQWPVPCDPQAPVEPSLPFSASFSAWALAMLYIFYVQGPCPILDQLGNFEGGRMLKWEWNVLVSECWLDLWAGFPPGCTGRGWGDRLGGHAPGVLKQS